MIEINLVVRDADGNDTGKRRSFKDSEGEKISRFYSEARTKIKNQNEKKGASHKKELKDIVRKIFGEKNGE